MTEVKRGKAVKELKYQPKEYVCEIHTNICIHTCTHVYVYTYICTCTYTDNYLLHSIYTCTRLFNLSANPVKKDINDQRS